MDRNEITSIARDAIIGTIDVLDVNHALSRLNQSTHILTVRSKESPFHSPDLRSGLTGYDLVTSEEQGIISACDTLINFLIEWGFDYDKAVDLILQFISHALDPVDPSIVNEYRFNSALESLLSWIHGKERLEFIVPISNIKDTDTLWQIDTMIIDHPPLDRFNSIGVTLRKIRNDEVTNWLHLREKYYKSILTEVFAVVFTFEYGEPYKGYLNMNHYMIQYIETFFNCLRLVKGPQIGAHSAMVMYHLDLPPVSILEHLDRSISPRGFKIDLTPSDVTHAGDVWNRFIELHDSKIRWSIQRYMKAASESDDVDACIDLIISLESLFGPSTYTIALRAAAAVNVGEVITTEIFEFLTEVGYIRNNLFHGSSKPFKTIEDKYNREEFIEKLRELTQQCILKIMWQKKAKGSSIKPLRNDIEQSVWNETIRKNLADEIPDWTKGTFIPPKKKMDK